MTAPQTPEASATATGASGPTLRFGVYGQPKPKGSMRHVGKGRMIEQLEGSAPWREAVKHAALIAMDTGVSIDEWAGTLTGPLAIEAVITVAKPKSAPKRRRTWPVSQRSGDIDKHLRNILDALDDAAVMHDDSQYVQATVRKVYPGEDPDAFASPGAVIRVWEVTR